MDAITNREQVLKLPTTGLTATMEALEREEHALSAYQEKEKLPDAGPSAELGVTGAVPEEDGALEAGPAPEEDDTFEDTGAVPVENGVPEEFAIEEYMLEDAGGTALLPVTLVVEHTNLMDDDPGGRLLVEHVPLGELKTPN